MTQIKTVLSIFSWGKKVLLSHSFAMFRTVENIAVRRRELGGDSDDAEEVLTAYLNTLTKDEGEKTVGGCRKS